MMANAYNPSAWETESDGSPWSKGQPELDSKIKTKKRQKQNSSKQGCLWSET